MKVNPKPKNQNEYVKYDDLDGGDAFFHHNQLFVKGNHDEQEAVNLETGETVGSMCSYDVMPVEATVTWKYKTKTKKK